MRCWSYSSACSPACGYLTCKGSAVLAFVHKCNSTFLFTDLLHWCLPVPVQRVAHCASCGGDFIPSDTLSTSQL